MNQIEKEKGKLKKELLSRANKAMRKKTYTFKYVEKNNSKSFSDVFDSVVNEINSEVKKNGIILEYMVEEKRSMTTHFYLHTVYTVTVCIASDSEKLLGNIAIGKTDRAKARDGDDFSW